jgi:hypothetical protein
MKQRRSLKCVRAPEYHRQKQNFQSIRRQERKRGVLKKAAQKVLKFLQKLIQHLEVLPHTKSYQINKSKAKAHKKVYDQQHDKL